MLTVTQLRKFEGGQWHSDSLETLPDKIGEETVLWVDVENPSEAEITQLKSYFGLDNFEFKEIDDIGLRSKIEETEDKVYCLVNFPSADQFMAKPMTSRIILILSKRWILSVHRSHSNVTCEIYKKISTHGYFALSLIPSTEILLYIFLDLIVNECFSVSDLVHEMLQSLSQQAASRFRQKPKESNRSLGLEITKAREQVLVLRQSIGPLRQVVGRIARGEFVIVSGSTLPRFEDLYDRTISLIEVVDTHREEIQDIGDILINVQTVTTNNIIRVLTIISAIFLPLTLIAGIYGTNFEKGFYLPGSSSSIGFYLMIISMATIAVGLIATFRRKGWL